MTRAGLTEGIVLLLAAILGFIVLAELAAPRAAATVPTVHVQAAGLQRWPQLPALRAGPPLSLLPQSNGMRPVEEQPRAATTPRGTIGTAVIGGVASWYDDGPGLYAAVPDWHWGDTPYSLIVHRGRRSVLVLVRDHCGCNGRATIDLSPSAFRRLAPLSRGLIRVSIEGPVVPLPATDTP